MTDEKKNAEVFEKKWNWDTMLGFARHYNTTTNDDGLNKCTHTYNDRPLKNELVTLIFESGFKLKKLNWKRKNQSLLSLFSQNPSRKAYTSHFSPPSPLAVDDSETSGDAVYFVKFGNIKHFFFLWICFPTSA